MKRSSDAPASEAPELKKPKKLDVAALKASLSNKLKNLKGLTQGVIPSLHTGYNSMRADG